MRLVNIFPVNKYMYSLYWYVRLCIVSLSTSYTDPCYGTTRVFFLLFRHLFIQTYTTLNLVSRDSLSAVTSQAERIIMEKTPHLQDHARVQVREKGSVKVGRGRGRGWGQEQNVERLPDTVIILCMCTLEMDNNCKCMAYVSLAHNYHPLSV